MVEISYDLAGCRVLIVENDYMFAKYISYLLSHAGAQVIEPISNLEDALNFATDNERIDCALVDVKLNGKASWPLVDMLLARGMPLLLVTGYSVEAIPQCYAHLPRCERWVGEREVVHRLVQLLTDAGAP